MKYFFNIIVIIASTVFVSSPVLAAKCMDEKPNDKPDLFQIDVTRTTATLHFTPVNNAVTNYTIVYGYERGEQRFGVSFPFGKSDGVINYTINDLSPNMEYFFRVRADNGCRNGSFSDTMSVRTNWESKIYTRVKEITEEPTGVVSPSFGKNALKEITSLSKLTPQPSLQPSPQPSPTTSVVNAGQVKGASTTKVSRFVFFIPLLILSVLFFILSYIRRKDKTKSFIDE